MINPSLEPTFARALRAALITNVASSRARRSRRIGLTAGAVVAIGLAGGGAAVAADLLPLPGSDIDTPLAATATSIQNGPTMIDIGDAPTGTTHVEIAITCIRPGTITYPDGASVVCASDDSDSGHWSAMYTVPVAPGQVALVMDADPGLVWGLATTFVSRETTEWAINANGDTYGVMTDKGMPDLVAVIATNGEEGYAYAADLEGPMPSSPEEALAWQEARAGKTREVPVYLPDGETVIGTFEIG